MAIARMKDLSGIRDATAITSAPSTGQIAAAARNLLDAFHQQGISYCYWKSSQRLAAALAGNGDLDLLIERGDQYRAETILLENGFKHFRSVAHRDHASIISFLGYDEPSGQLIHLHVYFCLFAGNSLLKNHHLPWEQILLSRAILHPKFPIRVPDPACEALLWVVRVCLELGRTDPIVLRNWAAMKRKFATDRRELVTQVNRQVFHQLAVQLLGEDLADMAVGLLYSDRSLDSGNRLRRRIQRRLAPHRTYNAFEADLRAACRTAWWLAGGLNQRFLHLPRPWNRRAPGGGRIVALIGVDGSGKTTVAAAIRAWLSTEIDVIPIYFGTGGGRPSLWLRPFKLMLPLATRLVCNKPRGASHGQISNDAPGWLYAVPFMVWAAFAALEKRSKLLAARRGANRGLVILTDRFPQDEIVDFNDGPLLTRLKRAPLWLRQFEANAYALARRLPPDLIVKLEVAPEIASRREPDMDRAVIRERIAALPRLVFPGSRVVNVNAEQPLAQVIRAVKYEIWRLL